MTLKRFSFLMGMAAMLALCGPSLLVGDDASGLAIRRVRVDPPRLHLSGVDAEAQLLVTGETATGEAIDLTREAVISLDGNGSGIVTLGERGLVIARANGTARLFVSVGQLQIEVPVEVTGSESRAALNFERDLVPLLNKFGCNTAGCHGKAEGQNGFKLSVFGSDPAADFQALVMEGRGRRVFPAMPEQSLLLQKASGRMPHGGGVRIPPDRPEYRVWRDWIAAGMPLGSAADPRVVGIRVTLAERQLAMNRQQQLRIVARRSDGREFDVTRLATYQSNHDGLASVDEAGLVTIGNAPGNVAVMASYLGQVAVFQAIVPRGERIEPFPPLAETNFIDAAVNARLRQLQILPSGPCSDEDYVRRVYLDVIGTLPTADEVREFLNDKSSDRRATLVDRLLQRPEFATYWALKWSDLLRVDRGALGHRAAYLYYRWIRDSFAANKPLDRFARELLTAEGPLVESPAGHFYKVVNKPNEMANTLSQVLLGVRIECAQCHHHPFDRWSQQDYFGMQAFFTQVGSKPSPLGEMVLAASNAKTTHPREGYEVFAHALATAMPAESPSGDRRRLLAEWLTAANNPWFARNLVNRAWAHFLGRGLVEPVDDFRTTNPPSNPALLDALADHFVQSGFDFQALIRAITASAAYQRSAAVNTTNERDEQNYSRFLFKPLEAEVLLDAICHTTGVPEKFDGWPEGSRAIELWDSGVSHYLLKLFGRPVRATACECERVGEPSVSQVLHVLNSPEIQGKLSHAGGRLAKLGADRADNEPLVDELYLTYFARRPTSEQRTAALAWLEQQPDRPRAVEDLAWSMLNSVEFLFNH
jgi:hypothetical protein